MSQLFADPLEHRGPLSSLSCPGFLDPLKKALCMRWRKKWQPTLVFLPGEAQGPGSLGAAVSGVAQSRTRLK